MKRHIQFLALLFPVLILAQEIENVQDSILPNKLDEVIVTGESKVMSLSKKLFAVGVIDQKDIAQVAGNNLADILNYNLNISINPDPSTGRSTVTMFGLDGQYVKILLDGIPMASDNGMGNNIDITQINLEDVERIEIVEGSMGVLYGDNAVAGVINIVTKKGLGNYKWAINASLQEETVGSEYGLFDRGRHIQNLKIGHKINDKISVVVGASRNDYAGFYNDYKGKDYVNIENGLVVNDELRGTEWSPKKQLTAFGNMQLNLKKHSIFYKFQNYNEELDVYNHEINGRIDGSGNPNPTATDKRFTTHRIVNNINASGPLVGKTTYNLFISHQNQKRYFEQYVYNILQKGIESYSIDELSQSSNILYSKGFVSNIVPEKDFFNLQLGYEFTNQKGFDAIATGAFSPDVVENRLENYDFFGVADFNITDKLSFYPGARYTNNSQFGSKLIWSLSSTYDFSNTLKLKTVFGSAFRAPNFEELFYFFVDSNHNIQGNPNLNPEDGISIFLNLEKKFPIQDKGLFKSALKSYYFDIEDKIVFTLSDDELIQYTYYNIDESKVLGFSWENKLQYNDWQFGLGANYMGEATSIFSITDGKDDYLWSFNLQSNLSYTIPSLKTTVSALLKYNGKSQLFIEQGDGVGIRETNPYTWMDASFRTQLTDNFEVTLGVRNIMDIVTVDTSEITVGAHNATTSDVRLFGNGRSYFLKLLYKLNLN